MSLRVRRAESPPSAGRTRQSHVHSATHHLRITIPLRLACPVPNGFLPRFRAPSFRAEAAVGGRSRGICFNYLVSVAETGLVIPAKPVLSKVEGPGIQLFSPGPLLSQG